MIDGPGETTLFWLIVALILIGIGMAVTVDQWVDRTVIDRQWCDVHPSEPECLPPTVPTVELPQVGP